MTDKLSLANGALRLLTERRLSAGELSGGTREPARIINDAWDDGFVKGCLEAGMWKFAMRSIQLDASPSVTPSFGFQYAYDKPVDFVRNAGSFSDETMRTPLLDMREEAGFFFANIETIYIRYVSDDTDYGYDYSLWPQTFVKYVEAKLAGQIAGPLTAKGTEMFGYAKIALKDALSMDALTDPERVQRPGMWIRARTSSGFRRDGQPR